MPAISRVFSKATAAWLARDETSSSSTLVKGTTFSSTSAAWRSMARGSRFLLISCSTPMTSSWWSRMGTTSIDLVR